MSIHPSRALRTFALGVLTIAVLSPDRVIGATELAASTAPTGAARRWEASIPIGRHGEAHARTGRALFRLPTCGWSGLGSDTSFTLFHNPSSAWDQPPPQQLPVLQGHGTMTNLLLDPIEILPPPPPPASDAIWTSNYSICLDIPQLMSFQQTFTVVWGDGTKDRYRTLFGSGVFTPPAGVFDTLTADAAPGDGYLLTTKSQTKVHFDADGRLDYIEDPSGNRQTCHYINDSQNPADGELAYVEDAAGRRLELFYNTHGRLSLIRAPFGGNGNPTHRTWTLLYEDPFSIIGPTLEGNGPFAALEDPLGHRISMTYTADYEIATITDKNDSTWQLSYSDLGRIDTVIDPLLQTASFEYYDNVSNDETRYIDVRGKTWKYFFAKGTGNLLVTLNPLNEATRLTYADPRPQLVHEPTAVTNALNKSWISSYDDNGNVLTNTDPLGNVTTFTYDAWNNLRTTSPPDDLVPGTSNSLKTVEIRYEDPAHPTSPTSMIQPADGNGNPEAITTIEYYDADDFTAVGLGAWNGLVHRVTDANGVVTEYEYDQWGQPSSETENPDAVVAVSSSIATYPTYRKTTEYTAGGIAIDGSRPFQFRGDCPTWPFIFLTHDDDGRLVSALCGAIFPQACLIDVNEPYPGSPPSGCVNVGGYTPTGRPLSVSTCGSSSAGQQSAAATGLSGPIDKSYQVTYDAMDRPFTWQVSSNEATLVPGGSGSLVTRTFSSVYDDLAGTVTTTGPDGETIAYTTDDAGRTKTITRTTLAGDLTIEYSYDVAGRVTLVKNGNGMDVRYQYDDADRKTQIRYENASDQSLILQLNYNYTADGLLASIDRLNDQDAGSVVYEYDLRNRLASETYYESTFWTLIAYTYDQGGNRLTKVDLSSGRRTVYHYDVTDNDDGGQHNNRLLSSEVIDLGTDTVIERTWYRYGVNGNVIRLVKQTPQPKNETLIYWFNYDRSDNLWVSTSGTGDYNELTGEVSNSTFFASAEYRYESGRQRYLVRPLDPNNGFEPLPGARWHDYLGNEIYNDYAVTPSGAVTEGTAHLSSIGFSDPIAADMPAYYASDQIGSVRQILGNGTGNPPTLREVMYTAFGEHLESQGPADSRYGYVGAFGYQTPGCHDEGGLNGTGWCDPLEELGWLHVGARYYDPAVGRFMQRDPIGIRGGDNVYVYTGNRPTLRLDPDGLTTVSVGVEALGIGPGIAGVGNINVNFGYSTASGFTCNTTLTGGAGIGWGLAGGVNPTLTITSAPDVNWLPGPGVLIAGALPNGGVGLVGGPGYVGGSVGAGGPGAGSGVGALATTTVDITRPIGNLIWRLFGTPGPPGYRPY